LQRFDLDFGYALDVKPFEEIWAVPKDRDEPIDTTRGDVLPGAADA